MKLCNRPRRHTRLAVIVVALAAVLALWVAPGALAGNQDITTEVGRLEVGGVAVRSVTLSNTSGDTRTFSVFIDRSLDVVVSAGYTTDCPATPPPHPSEGPFTLPVGGSCHVFFRLDAHAASEVTSTQQIYFGCAFGDCFLHPGSFTIYVHLHVTVAPSAPPVFPPLSTVFAVTSSPLGATVGFAVTAVDAVDGPIAALCSPPSGSFFPPGLTLVTCRADDTSGHFGLASFYVHVGFGGPPSVSVPALLTVRSSSPAGRLVTYPSIGLDQLGRTLPTNCSNPSGSFFPVGTTTVTCFATDAAGDVGSASFPLTVEAAPSSIDSGPAPASFASTTTQDAPFSWSTAVRGQRTVCSLDGAPYAPCSSPRTYHGLAAGGHVFCVEAVVNGTPEATPDCFIWAIVGPGAPSVTFTMTPAGVDGHDAPFAWSADQSGVRYECALDSATFVACSGPRTYHGLATGAHFLFVRATNFAGQMGSPADYYWLVT